MTPGTRSLIAVLVGFGVLIFTGQILESWFVPWILAVIAGVVTWLITAPRARSGSQQ